MSKLVNLTFVIAMVALGATGSVVGQDGVSSARVARQRALWKLRGCVTLPIGRGCSEDTAAFLIDRYKKGDSQMLNALLDVGRHSDGALSETVGTFYAARLEQEPIQFLCALSHRSLSEQRKLAQLAGSTDGGGMSDEQLLHIRRELNRITLSRDRMNSRLAVLCLSEINAASARVRSHSFDAGSKSVGY